MKEYRFTVVVHTEKGDELAARVALSKLIQGDYVTAEAWDELLDGLRGDREDDAYITLEEA